MAAIPPQRAKVEHDAPKKLNDWLDHLPAPDWKAIGSRLKGNAVALRHRRRDRTEQRELRRVEQVKARHSLEATDGAPPAGATVGVEAADQSPSRTTGNAAAAASNNAYPVKESAAALHGGAEAPSGMPGSTAAAAAEPGPAVAQPAGATKPRAADVDLAALVESARAAIRARATEADAHSYTVLSADAAPEVGLPGMASGAALGARAHARDGSRNAVVGSGSAIVAGDSGSGTVDGDSGSGTVDGDSGLGFAAVARNIVTGVTDPRPTDQELRDASPFWVDDDEPLYVPPYNLPSRTPDPPENQQDRLRRAVVAGAAVVALLLGFLGLGLFGGDTAHSGVDSPFRPRAALLSPGVDSFMIWGLIFCWIVVFAVYQWHPSQRSSPRQRDLGYPTAGAALLGALWLLAARAGMAATAMWIAIALTAVLVYCLRLMNQRTARDNAERICVDAPGALFLGWMLTVLPMSVGVYLTSRGADFLLPGSWWATLTIIGATWAAASFSMSERGRIVLAIGFGWGLFWIMLVRLLGPTFSTPVAIVAGLCAFIVLLATENRRYQIGHAERRAARGQRTEF